MQPPTIFRSLYDFLATMIPYLDYQRSVAGKLSQCRSVLDLGCGRASAIYCLPEHVRFLSVGIDLYRPYITESKEKRIHGNYVIADVRFIPFRDKCFDAAVALDLIEHLEKLDGLRVLNDMKRITKTRIIVFTPNGFLQQREYDDNPLQVHRYGWSVEELKAMGFKVLGMNGFKPLRGEKATARIKPRILGSLLSLFTQLLVWKIPKISFQLLCIKDL